MVYDRIKEICEKKGMSIASVEKAAGLGKGAISKWNSSSPTIKSISAVASVLGVTVNRLLKE